MNSAIGLELSQCTNTTEVAILLEVVEWEQIGQVI